ncbi:hypothetical protein IB237_23200 [Agrobacterium sp. AGB01]|uniref:hypothetical protein n=1 Tax=Agrobacterium sp. AGB01 TaxID=2769302 RepID=UPI0017814422|nr:hypothetical protein [Agrobacterium sp. AGB01]MBD9390111.1 hypothetical protein [Agrobacterium sp. AGB01]
MASTFHAAGTTGWQSLVVGSGSKRFGVQVVTTHPVLIHVGQSAPAADTQDYVLLSAERTRELVLDLDAADTVYVKSDAATSVAVRGWKETRA